jgi:hypothetical protein
MIVLKPNKLSASSLISTNAVETVALWNAATNYTVGTLVRRDTTNRIYECLTAGVNADLPEVSAALATGARWLDTGPSNKYAILDEQIATKTSATTQLTFVIAPTACTSVALFGIEGAYSATITVRDGVAGPIVFTKTQALDATLITDWFEYFFELSVPKPDLIVTGIPPYHNAHVTVTLTGTTGVTVKCGVFLAGFTYDLGATNYGASAGIIDYSKKDTDEFGNTAFVRRAYSKRLSAKLDVPNTKLNKIQYVLAELRATPSAWMGTNEFGYDPLTVYGFYKDFSIEVQYADWSACSLEIEGLI